MPTKLCKHCELKPQTTYYGLCDDCRKVRGYRILYIYRRKHWTPEWDRHLDDLTARATLHLPLFEEITDEQLQAARRQAAERNRRHQAKVSLVRAEEKPQHLREGESRRDLRSPQGLPVRLAEAPGHQAPGAEEAQRHQARDRRDVEAANPAVPGGRDSPSESEAQGRPASGAARAPEAA